MAGFRRDGHIYYNFIICMYMHVHEAIARVNVQASCV